MKTIWIKKFSLNVIKDIVNVYLKFVCNFGNSTRRKSIKSPWFWHIQFNFNWKNGSFIITQANGTRQFFTSMLTTQGKFKLWNGIDARAPPIKRMKSFQFTWIKNGIQSFVVFAAILWWCSKLNPTNNPVEMTLNGIVINSELVNLSEKLCCVWTATRDSKQRKLNYPIDYRYGINLKIVCKTSHVFLLILLAGDVAINPGPTTTLPRTSATAQSSLGSDNVTNIHCMQCLYFNARSLTNKICELQTLVTDVDLLAVTETWLKPGIENGELLPGNDFTPSIVATGLGEQAVEHC